MKILHVLTQLPAKTGSGVYFTNLIESLDNLGYENAAVFGTENIYQNNINADFLKPVYYNTESMPFNICGMSDLMPYDSTVYSKMSEEDIDVLIDNFRKALIEVKDEFNPDIVISHHLFLITDLVREVFNDKQVVGISHGTDIRQIKKHHKFLPRLTHIKNLDYVLTVTDKEDDAIINLLDINRNKIYNVGGGYNQEVFYPLEEDTDKNTIDIVYAGKISQSKGVFELVKTLPILEKKYPQIRLHIVGNADLKSCRKMKELVNHSPRLIICHALDQEKLANLLRQADIFVLPSYFEALGLIAIEALACHKLVVASYIEGLEKLLGEEIKNKELIKFTELPRIYDVDKPVKEDIPGYVSRLSNNIEKQINRLDENLFTEEVNSEIQTLAWANIGQKIINVIKNKKKY